MVIQACSPIPSCDAVIFKVSLHGHCRRKESTRNQVTLVQKWYILYLFHSIGQNFTWPHTDKGRTEKSSPGWAVTSQWQQYTLVFCCLFLFHSALRTLFHESSLLTPKWPALFPIPNELFIIMKSSSLSHQLQIQFFKKINGSGEEWVPLHGWHYSSLPFMISRARNPPIKIGSSFRKFKKTRCNNW